MPTTADGTAIPAGPVGGLISAVYAAQYLPDLGDDQVLALPSVILAASRMIRLHCNRYLSRRPSADGTLGPIDQVYTRANRGPILLREYPVNDVFRVSTSPTVILSVANADAATNQIARARLIRAGDAIGGYTTTGLYLERFASGVQIPTTILFSSLATPTVGALAQAVNATGGGWQASAGANGSGSDYAAWPAAELRSGQGAKGALQGPAEFLAYVEDSPFSRDNEAGVISVDGGGRNPYTSLRFGPTAGLDFGDEDIRGEYQGVRVVYDAGFEPIPDDLQQATVEAVKAMFERKELSTAKLSERTDTYAWTAREFIHALPGPVVEVLAYYRDHTG